jgi:hypothetical protein
MSTIYPTADATGERNTAIGFLVAGLAIAYPCVTVALVRIHYLLGHSDLSKHTQAMLRVLTFPMCIGCAFALLILIADARGRKRVAGIGLCAIGIVLNVILVFAFGFTV